MIATTSGFGRLTVALLGLSLVACTGGSESPSPSDKPPASDAKQPAAAKPAEPVDAPTTAVPIEPQPPEATPDPVELGVAADSGEPGSAGTTDGSAVDDAPPTSVRKPVEQPQKRPAKTYGGPPTPADEPW